MLFAGEELFVINVPAHNVLLLSGHLLEEEALAVFINCGEELAGVCGVIGHQQIEEG